MAEPVSMPHYHVVDGRVEIDWPRSPSDDPFPEIDLLPTMRDARRLLARALHSLADWIEP